MVSFSDEVSWDGMLIVAVFTELFGSVCQKFNISVPVTGGTPNGSNITSPTSPSPPVYTGDAGVVVQRGVWALLLALAGVFLTNVDIV